MPTINNLFGDAYSTIYRTHDEFGDISVVDWRDVRVLTFETSFEHNSIEQSRMDLKKPYRLVHEYTRGMILVLALIQPMDVLVLGLGGGCLIRSITHAVPGCNIQAVELRQEVYDVAKQFFELPINDSIHITIGDARDFLENAAAQSTDIIFSDLYQPRGMDRFQLQRDFIQHSARVLKPMGWLVVNYHKRPQEDLFFYSCLRRYFSTLFLCPTDSGNYILLAGNQPIDELHRFDAAVEKLELKLEIRLMHLFKRFQRCE